MFRASSSWCRKNLFLVFLVGNDEKWNPTITWPKNIVLLNVLSNCGSVEKFMQYHNLKWIINFVKKSFDKFDKIYHILKILQRIFLSKFSNNQIRAFQSFLKERAFSLNSKTKIYIFLLYISNSWKSEIKHDFFI